MMKHFLIRLLAVLLALITLAAPALAEEELRGYSKKNGYVYVTLGTFPQTADGGVEPLIWRVLSVTDGKAYLISEYVLEARRIHGDYQEYANKPTNKKKPGFDGDFTQTEMALYLNGQFAGENFTEGELALIAADEVYGMFYLPSDTDLKNTAYGLGTNKTRKAWGTEYAKANGLFVYGSKYGRHSPYWTLTQSTSDARHARCTKDEGEIGRINVITLDLGMRPVTNLDMSRVVILSGTGTLEDPFVLDTGLAATDVPAEAPAEVPAEDACCVPGQCFCCTSCTCGCQDAE